jgi:hypothetical protein
VTDRRDLRCAQLARSRPLCAELLTFRAQEFTEAAQPPASPMLALSSAISRPTP